MSDTDRGELPWDRPKADPADGDLFAQDDAAAFLEPLLREYGMTLDNVVAYRLQRARLEAWPVLKDPPSGRE